MGDVVSVRGDAFSGFAEQRGTKINARLRGVASYAALDALELMLSRVHEVAERASVDETIVDLRELEFMSSSCLKTMIAWINEIQLMDVERRYRVRLVSNPEVHWQRRSLESLRCFASELITVDT
jgi:hypothetical protein